VAKAAPSGRIPDGALQGLLTTGGPDVRPGFLLLDLRRHRRVSRRVARTFVRVSYYSTCAATDGCPDGWPGRSSGFLTTRPAPPQTGVPTGGPDVRPGFLLLGLRRHGRVSRMGGPDVRPGFLLLGLRRHDGWPGRVSRTFVRVSYYSTCTATDGCPDGWPGRSSGFLTTRPAPPRTGVPVGVPDVRPGFQAHSQCAATSMESRANGTSLSP
jgi:hypothetical protein